MKIALDAMGSDSAPRAELEGIALALEEMHDLEVVLVGKPDIINAMQNHRSGRVELVPATEVVGMHESPTEALKRKRDSSIAVCMNLLKEGRVSGVVSAGNTGAVMAFALTTLGAIPGIYRPTLAVLFPTLKDSTLVLDVGANVDCKPLQLLQFGLIGSTAASYLFRKANPTVGLLSIGREEGKGNDLTVNAHELLEKSEVNFIGNVEGSDIMNGTVDVVICDGFVGNAMLKYAEGLADILSHLLEGYLESESKYRLRRWISRPVLHEFIGRMDYQERGGALMLGLQGTVVVAHGKSTPRAIMNALRSATQAANDSLAEHIRQCFAARVAPA